MLFVDLASGQPKTKVQLQQENKHMSLPSSWTDATLTALNVARVEKVNSPSVGEWQVAEKDGIEEVDGVWREKWTVKEMFTEYTATDENGIETTVTVQDQKDAVVTNKGNKEREKRDKLLKETDWLAIKAFETNTTLSSDMATYRQALRDIPQQEGFPNTITWPTKPSE